VGEEATTAAPRRLEKAATRASAGAPAAARSAPSRMDTSAARVGEAAAAGAASPFRLERAACVAPLTALRRAPLPIDSLRPRLLAALRTHALLVLTGGTGCANAPL